MSASSNLEETIFEQALGLSSPEARDSFLRDACGPDDAMRERLQGLLAAHDRSGRFLEHQAPEPEAGAAARGASVCPRCGQRRPLGAPQGLCPGCLLLGGLRGVPPSGGAGKNPSEAGTPDTTLLAPLTERPGDRIGRYKLLEQIGEGGMGVVWMAEQEEPVRRRVALKIIKLGMDTRSVVARFEAERQALAMMDHPNIARVFDGGATGQESGARRQKSEEGASDARPLTPDSRLLTSGSGRPYFVMELVRGLPITKYCDEAKLSTRQRLELFGQVCRAVQHAHQKGIIHRDLKPSNILVTVQDDRPVVKVIDFGIAKATEGRLTDKTLFTGFAQLIGTPAYMSPEQAGLGSLDIDTRSDTYSLGVVLYELLTGHPPFDTKELLKEGYEAVLRTIREVDPPKPSTRLTDLVAADVRRLSSKSEIRNPKSEEDRASSRRLLQEVRGDLDWIVMKCLEKDRARRYETANGLAADLERYLHDEPVLARPPSTGYRLRKFVRKHRVPVTAAAAIVVLLVAATAVSLALAMWANTERERAEKAQKSEATQRLAAEDAEREQGRLRQQAEANEKTATTEAAKSRQVAQFLKEMLEGVGPSVALGRDTKLLREILDKTTGRLDKDLKDQPEVEAELKDALGEVYAELSEYKSAEAMHRQAIELKRKLFGNEHRSVAASLGSLASVLRKQRKLSEAEILSREALGILRTSVGDVHPQVAAELSNLAVVLEARGKFKEAEDIYAQVLPELRKHFGNEDRLVAVALHNLATLRQRQGRLREAESLHREVLAMRQKLFGDEHLDVAASLNNLGVVLEARGKLEEAETVFRRTLATWRKLIGKPHHRIVLVLNSLGSVLDGQGRLPDAETAYRESVAMQKELYGDDHPDLHFPLASLGVVLQQQDKLAEAESLFREALAIRKKHLGNEHPYVVALVQHLGAGLERQGKLEEAEPVAREALDLAQKAHGKQSREAADSLGLLARVLLRSERFAEAEPVARECLTLHENLEPSNWRTSRARSLVGVSLLGQKKYAEAELLLAQAYEGLKWQATERPSSSRAAALQETAERLGQLCETLGKPEKAAQWRAKVKEAAVPGANVQP